VGPPGELAQVALGVLLVARLAEDLAVQVDLGVAAQDQVAGHRRHLAAGVLDDDLPRVAVGQLLDVRRLDGEVDAELLEDRAPLRRRAGED
jgi:hypothetical protein